MYLTSSIREAMSMSKAQLVAELKPYILYGLQGASKDQLVSMWLTRFGTKELDDTEINQQMTEVYKSI